MTAGRTTAQVSSTGRDLVPSVLLSLVVLLLLGRHAASWDRTHLEVTITAMTISVIAPLVTLVALRRRANVAVWSLPSLLTVAAAVWLALAT